MPVTRLNHAVLYVRDVEVTREFYEEALGLRDADPPARPGRLPPGARAPPTTTTSGVFQIGSGAGPSGAGRSTVGLYHLAWEVDTLDELERLRACWPTGARWSGASDHVTTKSLYAHDPDGIEFEVCWILPADGAHPGAQGRGRRPIPGPGPSTSRPRRPATAAQTRGGVGVSIPACAWPDQPCRARTDRAGWPIQVLPGRPILPRCRRSIARRGVESIATGGRCGMAGRRRAVPRRRHLGRRRWSCSSCAPSSASPPRTSSAASSPSGGSTSVTAVADVMLATAIHVALAGAGAVPHLGPTDPP